MGQRWQLRTWTKGTGASVEPAGAPDRPRTRARPGGLPALPAKRQWAPTACHTAPALPGQRVQKDARRRHALGYLDEAALDRLEALESDLDQAPGVWPPRARG
jgi:hypothetical protein